MSDNNVVVVNVLYYNADFPKDSSASVTMLFPAVCPHKFVTIDDDKNGTWHCKLMENGQWVVHRDDGPALIQDNRVWFFKDGFNVHIEEMDVDNETKCLWLLQYESLTARNSDSFASYRR